jgi:DNA-binding transcriptional regulator LsrR (DeoR family)
MATDQDTSRLDDAARAGWLYFIAGNTQDEIARKLSVSRQTAQRLVSLAVSEKLVTFRLQHPVAACMELAERMVERFGLTHCEVALADPAAEGSLAGVAGLAAAFLESRLRNGKHMIVGLGTGRAMRASVDQIPRMNCPNHQLVSMVGNIAPDGSATFFDVLSKLADLTQSRHYPMPLPVFCASEQERAQLLALEPVRKVHGLAESADLIMVGLGQMGRTAPLHQDGFISGEELFQLMRHGAVGEIASWVFDGEGRILDAVTNRRTTSVPVRSRPGCPVVAVAVGHEKVEAIRSALRGELINGLITNETTARALLA